MSFHVELSVDTSKPVGGVTRRFAARFRAFTDTVLCEAVGLDDSCLKEDNVPITLIVGETRSVVVPLRFRLPIRLVVLLELLTLFLQITILIFNELPLLTVRGDDVEKVNVVAEPAAKIDPLGEAFAVPADAVGAANPVNDAPPLTE